MVHVDYISNTAKGGCEGDAHERNDRVETGLQPGEGTCGRALALRSQRAWGSLGVGLWRPGERLRHRRARSSGAQLGEQMGDQERGRAEANVLGEGSQLRLSSER